MKKNTKTTITAISIALVLILLTFGLFKAGLIQLSGIGSTFTPVYCNQYSFTCCVEQKAETSTFSETGATANAQCPSTATKCVATNAPTTYPYAYFGTSNCKVSSFLFLNSFGCTDAQQITTGETLAKGGFIYGKTPVVFDVYRQKLLFTGRAGSTVGVPVSGADQCSFITDKSIYSDTGNLLKQPSAGGVSYTVSTNTCILSWNQGDRTICGNLEEQCSTDASCTGHTFGNKECTAKTLQTYGCTKLSLPNGVTKKADGTLDGGDKLPNEQDYSGVSSRCEITSAVQVQCCGDTDCGSNAVCDKTTFTCKAPAQVQCKADYDCGVSTQCNINTKEIVKPTCNAGKCQQTVQSSVQCCGDSDCASGSFCDTDYKCKQGANLKSACPFECCPAQGSTDSQKYFDKNCQTGMYCDSTNACKAINPDTTSVSSNIGLWTFIIALIIGTIISYIALSVYIPIKNSKAKIAIVLILSLIIGTLFAFLVTLIVGIIVKAYNSVKGLFL